MGLGPVVVTETVSADANAVWKLITEADSRKLWWPEATLEAVVGAEVREQWAEVEDGQEIRRNASGEIDLVDEGRLLGFRWREEGDPYPTTVLIRLSQSERGASHTEVTVIESGFASLAAAADLVEHSELNWSVLLKELAILARQQNVGTAFEEDTACESQVLVYNEALAAGEAVEGELLEDDDNDDEVTVVIEGQKLTELEPTVDGSESAVIEIVVEDER